MNDKIRIGIVGYGRLGRGVEAAIKQQPDMRLEAIYTRRAPGAVRARDEATPVRSVRALDAGDEPADVLLLCGGSRDDLPAQSPKYAAKYHIVDSYDNHAQIPEHLAAVDSAARAGGRTAIISCGWDPGIFSLARLFGEAFLPRGQTYTFWGEGVSQGHSDALRQVPGVLDAVQYTIPAAAALDKIRRGEEPDLSPPNAHRRECFVALKPGADPDVVRAAIVEMPDYFAPYQTEVHFISPEELRAEHTQIPHGGHVFRSAQTGGGARQLIETRLKLGSNPEFTASVLVAFARAAFRLASRGELGAKTPLDIAPALLSPRPIEELVRDLL